MTLLSTKCEACDGTGRTPPNHRVTCQPCLGTGQVSHLPKPPDTYYFSAFLLFVLLNVVWGCYAVIGWLNQ